MTSHPSFSVQYPALQIIGCLVCGDQQVIEKLIKMNILNCFVKILKSNKRASPRKACSAIAKILEGKPLNIQTVIDANIFPSVIELLETGSIETRNAAALVIKYASEGAPGQIEYLVKQVGVFAE